MPPTPTNDAETGRRIAHDLAGNFIVEAGAGTGKTYALVSRVVALVKAGVPMPNIVAITFTEAAAAELAERIRSRMEQLLTPGHPDNEADLLAQDLTETHRRHIRTAVAELDQASIQTIHSFAAQLLRERPLEAGLPPGWATLDDVETSERFADRWEEWLEWALGRDTGVDADLQTALRYLLAANVGIKNWQDIAKSFAANHYRLGSADSANLAAVISGCLNALNELLAECRDESDDLASRIRELAQTAEALSEIAKAPAATAHGQIRRPSLRVSRTGRRENWNDIGKARADFSEIAEALDDAVLAVLMRSLRQAFAVDYAARRKADGVATFDDLLVWARDLLRDNAAVRAYFRQKYSRILIDEFQDTDPLQAEIACYLAAAPDAPVGRQDWHTLPLDAGRLFIVGDAKQSIYRFRSADISVVQRVKAGGRLEALSISENRRSQKPVLDWVNAVFGGRDGTPGLMRPADGMQPEYIALQPNAGVLLDGLGSVQVFGGPADLPAALLAREQAKQVASLIAACAGPGGDRLEVYDKSAGQVRPANLRDVCILIRSRTGLGILTRQLEESGIPCRLEGASLFFDAQEVRDLLNCLRAVDDPSDEVAVVAALRSPAFACSDADLLRWRDAGGRWNYRQTLPDCAAPVRDGLQKIGEYHEKSRAGGVARLIADFIRERRLDELDLAENRPRETWRRRQFLVEQARNLEYAGNAGGGGAAPLTLSQFLRWAQSREDENARITEVAVPEADDDAVRIMTMHAAKGLEFPIVILTGLAGNPRNRSGAALFDASGGPAEVKAGNLQTPGYPARAEYEKAHAAAEDVRLAYVAATRARDHLLVSMHHSTRGNSRQNSGIVAQIAGLAAAIALPQRQRAVSVDNDRGRRPNRPVSGALPPGDYAPAEWEESRRVVIARRSVRQAVTATGIANDGKEQEPGERQRGRGGRSGTAFGSALHAVLQNTVDAMLPELPLPPDQSVDALLAEWTERIECQAARQADSGGIASDRRSELVRLARSALRNPAVVAALRAPRLWPEIPVSAPIDTPQGRVVIEGIIDLLYADADGQLVILDYKSDDISEAELAGRLAHYHQQGAAYAAAVERATGRTVREAQFLFVRPDTVHPVPGLRDLMARLPERIAAGE